MNLYIVSSYLTTGQLTYIFRVVIQILAFVGPFLLVRIILGSAPRVAQFETHDTLNRIVGSSTASKTTLLWIKNRLARKKHDPTYQSRLLCALVLLLCYGVFVSVSDVGLIGIQTCFIPFPAYNDSPASVRSVSDAHALLAKTLVNGTDPSTVKSARCDSVKTTTLSRNKTSNECTSWSNSTYGEVSAFSSLNLTDTAALMFQNLAGPQSSKNNGLPVYYFGAMGRTEPKAKVRAGLAVVPHATGVRMITGTPNLSKNQSVSLPRAMSIDVTLGCLPVGIIIEAIPEEANARRGGFATAYFVPDNLYNSATAAQYTGPDYLFQPLSTAAQQLRQLRLPTFNQSWLSAEGYFHGKETLMEYGASWRSQIARTQLETSTTLGKSTTATQIRNILNSCGELVHAAIGATSSLQSQPDSLIPGACSELRLGGSSTQDGNITLRSTDMICASTTEINLVQATLETDSAGLLSASVSNLPSTLHELSADDTHDMIRRFTLSENPSGGLHHYILQTLPSALLNASYQPPPGLFSGLDSVGVSISQLGNAALQTWFSQGSELVVNKTFLTASADDIHASSMVTKWAGEYVASIMLSSFALNGYTALGKPPLVVKSTGGRHAVCYQPMYVAGFVPLVISALGIFVWAFLMLITSQFRGVKRKEEKYGGLAPARITEQPPHKHEPDEVLMWEEVSTPEVRLDHSSSSFSTLMTVESRANDERMVLVSSENNT